MDQYKIHDIHDDSIMSKPMTLYDKLFSDKIEDPRFNYYKCIDIEMKNHEILCISDLHADVRRFWFFLYRQKLVLQKNMPSLSEIKWNPIMTNKALVICGDIIDGRRPPNNNLHATENDEILIHALIYNLRLEAIKYNSFVFCTLGNHDFFAFHDGSLMSPHAYIHYMDDNSKQNYIGAFNSSLTNLKEPNEEHVIDKITDNDKSYFIRTHVLSRFYLIGFQFFLKINETLFAHAGFHKDDNIISLFENGKNSNTQLQPMLIHRKILEQMADLDTLIGFIEFDQRRAITPTYAKYYDNIFDLTILELQKSGKYDPIVTQAYSELFQDLTDTSVIKHLFEMRTLQKNCPEVDEILQTYGCKMLVVGHCPTCLGPNFFDAKNITGIQDCDNARIVFSCDNKLLSVDTALSSGFSPLKQFVECLSIIKSESGELYMKVIRHNLDINIVKEYNYLRYDNHFKKWLKYSPSNSNSNDSSSDSDDDGNYYLASRPSMQDLSALFANPPKPSNYNSSKSASASNSKNR